MKKFLAISLATAMAMSTMVFAAPLLEDDGNLIVEPVKAVSEETTEATTDETTETATEAKGIALSNSAFELSGKTMVPLREVAEQLGFTVEWNPEVKAIQVDNGENSVELSVGVDNYYVVKDSSKEFSTPITLGVAPTIKEEITFVPIEMFRMLINSSKDLSLKYDTIVIDDRTTEATTEATTKAESTTASNALAPVSSRHPVVVQKGKEPVNNSNIHVITTTIATTTTTTETTTETTTAVKLDSSLTNNVANDKADGGLSTVNPMKPYTSVAEAIKDLGFTMDNCNIEGYTLTDVNTISGKMLQLDYTKGTKELCVRIAVSNDDISGNYGKYPSKVKYTFNNCLVTLEGDRVFYPKATWHDGSFAYSVGCDDNIPQAEMANIAEQVAYFGAK